MSDPRPLIASTVLLCASCASWYWMKLPSKGGPAWFELRSEHFTLQTDVDEANAKALAAELENRRSALLAAAWHRAEFPGPATRVIVFRDAEELEEFALWVILGFLLHDLTGEKVMVLAHHAGRSPPGMSGYYDLQRVMTHELAHDLSSFYFARRPQWITEGLARFLETMVLNVKARSATIGDRPYPQYCRVGRVIEKRFADDELDEDAAGCLVFYLVNFKGKEFNEYQKALFRGDALETAWKANFPAYSGPTGVHALAEAVDAALEPGFKYSVLTTSFVPYQGAPAVRIMPEPEIRALRGQLFFLGPRLPSEDQDRGAKARAEADAALQDDPLQSGALELRVQLAADRTEKLLAARTAVRLDASDARSWMLVDEALGEERGTTEEEALRTSSLERAVSLAPANAWALQRLARAYARTDQAPRGVDFVHRSLQIQPDSPEALDTFAWIAEKQGTCRAAFELERMAVERLPQKRQDADSKSAPWEVRAEAMRQRLAAYGKACLQ